MRTCCPECGAPGTDLRISSTAWFKFEDTDSVQDASTFACVDYDSVPTIGCNSCDHTWTKYDKEIFADTKVPPLEHWVGQNASKLNCDIITHIINLSTLENEEADELARMIMTSVRQVFDPEINK